MTKEEARKIKAGDVLRAKYNDRYFLVEVEKVERRKGWSSTSPDTLQFVVRRKGAKKIDRIGNPVKNTLTLVSAQVGWAAETECRKDPIQANVYSDWLEENGFADAAKALRAAFPLAVPEGKK